jgi:hypothetical protein
MRTSFSLGVRARFSLSFGTDFRTRPNPVNNSSCSNPGTVPVFILALVPSLGLEPRPGLVGCRVSVQSQLGTSSGFSFSSGCGTDQEIEPGLVPGISSGSGFSFRVGLDSGLRILIPPTFFLPKVTSGSVYNWTGLSDHFS